MKTVREYLFKEMGISMPEGTINGDWFMKNDLPMIVSCTCCGATIALPSAMVDADGYLYCTSCVC